jgi:FKBP-type peptidyl-prolyl cis-trans isomerase FkpA
MTKKLAAYLTLCLCLISISACAQGGSAPPAAGASGGSLETDEQKTLYALGAMLGRNIAQFKLKAEELELVKKGLADSASGATPQVDLNTYGPKVNEMAQARMTAGAAEEKKTGQEFAEKAAQEQGATRGSTGVIHRTVTAGTGKSPTANDTVKVHYEGRLVNGTVFDSSVKRGEPAEFPLRGVVPCWTEGLQKMKIGEKAQLVCPSDTAYGDRGSPPTIPPGATLIFDVELLSISAGPSAAK